MRRWFKAVKDYIRYDIPYGIENLIKWFPIVWKDRDYDFYFIYVTLRHKLHLTEQHIRNHDIHTRAKEDADKIKLCVNLLDRLIADDYHEIAFKRHDEKWGAGELNFKKLPENDELYEGIISHKHVHTEEDKEKERKDFKTAYEHEQYLKNQDKEMLFKLMNKYIEGWWD